MNDKLKAFWIGFKELVKDLFQKSDSIIDSKDENINYDSLTPKVLNYKEVETYMYALKTGIDDEDIRNIALTGTYGSGKSSLIKTFINKFKTKYKFLNISLASFENGGTTQNIEKKVELSIIQQIIYHVKASKIPDSRFKRINNITKSQMIWFLLGFSIWTLSTIIIYKFNYLNSLNPRNWNGNPQYVDLVAIILYGIFFLGVAFLIKKIIRFFNNSKISKVSLKGEVDFDNVDKSILNEYLDELLYFFERNHYDVIVIEDLDRFKNSLEIFTKLREINSLINNSEQRKNKGKIVFIYAIKDDIFTQEKERTKFFDFIIPVIPIINKSNSAGKLRERLLFLDENDRPSETFLDDISLFVDDMRLLNNICNEYLVYRKNLSPKLNTDRLLSMMVYKNIRPDDFNLLNKGEGKLHDILNLRKEFISKKLVDVDMKLTELNSKIEKIENEKLNSVKELRAIYLNTLQDMLPQLYGVNLGSNTFTPNKLVSDKEFKMLQDSTNIIYKQQYSGNHLKDANSRKKFSDIEKNIDSDLSYDERENLILEKLNNSIDSYNIQIDSLKTEKRDVSALGMDKILSETSFDSLLTEDAQNDRLIMFLLRNGYIKEDYFDYVSYFHEGSITSNDNDFLQSIKSKLSVSSDYNLDKVENVIDRISLEHFKDEYVLNYDLVDTLVKNKTKYNIKINALLDSLVFKQDSAIKFLYDYKDIGREVKGFVQLLCKKDKNLWKFIESNTEYNSKLKNELLLLVLNNSDIKDIITLSKSSSINKYLSDKKEPISFFAQLLSFEKAKKIISQLKLKFNFLDKPRHSQSELFEYVKFNNLYVLNKRNIDFIINHENSEVSQEQLDTQNYTTIVNSKSDKLKEYVEDNISKYADEILLSLTENNDENEKVLIRLLNNIELSDEQKERLIEHNSNLVIDLKTIDENDVKAMLLNQFMIKVNWKNVLNYYLAVAEDKLDEPLFNYLNSENIYKELSKHQLSLTSYDHDDQKKISLAIIECNEFEIDSYESLLKSVLQKWTGLDLSKIEKEKVEKIIDLKFINLSVIYYDDLRSDFKGLHLKFIENNFNEFLKNFDEYEMDEDEITQLLNSSKVNDNKKIEYIKELDEYTITESKKLGAKVTELISKNDYGALNYSFLLDLFNCSDSNDDRIKLFNNQAGYLSPEEAKSLVAQLSYPYSDFLVPRKQTKLKASQLNIDFTENIKRKGIVSSVSIKRGKVKVVAKYS